MTQHGGDGEVGEAAIAERGGQVVAEVVVAYILVT